MRTNVVVDDDLMESALKVSGLKTKKDAIEEELKRQALIESEREVVRAAMLAAEKILATGK